MNIFILRHGQAEHPLTSDEARNLTAKGRADVTRIVSENSIELSAIQQIWTSPLIRAQQTAEIARTILHSQNSSLIIHITDLIIPEAKPNAFFDYLQSTQIESVLIASHQPFVSSFIDFFCGAEQGFHSMNTSSLACIDYEVAAPAMGQLRWLKHINE